MADNAMLNWSDGLPSQLIEISANDSGAIKYWFNGLPSEYIIASGGAPPAATNIVMMVIST